jgi:hypothetical protein
VDEVEAMHDGAGCAQLTCGGDQKQHS